MKYYRYGRLRLKDHCVSWISIVILLFFSVASSMLKLSLGFVVFPIVYATIWILAILIPYGEQFAIYNNSIVVLSGKRKRIIDLPSDLTLVVSYVDICPPLAIRTAIGNQTHILKDQYAISLLQKLPLNIVLETLHRNQVQKYTTSMIQRSFDDYRYIYSFVCNHSLIELLICDRGYNLIIPESLWQKLHLDFNVDNIYIDKGY